jgi:hypothetical protein
MHGVEHVARVVVPLVAWENDASRDRASKLAETFLVDSHVSLGSTIHAAAHLSPPRRIAGVGLRRCLGHITIAVAEERGAADELSAPLSDIAAASSASASARKCEPSIGVI